MLFAQDFFTSQVEIMISRPNNSPEPPPIGGASPHSRLTELAARLSFCR
jgi:hypothetical protein